MRVYKRNLRSLEANKGERTCWSIGWFAEGFITNVLVKQVGGDPVNFRVNVFDSVKACDQPSQSSGGDDPEGEYTAEPEGHRLFDEMSGNAGEFARYTDEWGRAFRNQDGTWTRPVRRIYVQIEPEGSGPATWDVFISGHYDVG